MTDPTLLTLRGAHDLRLEADAYGDPSACPVVLLHGGGQTRQSWGDTGAALAEMGFWALCLDARGHGGSAWDSEGDYSLDAFRDDLAAVVAQLDRPPAVIGASLGGLTAMLLAGERPDRTLQALVLVDIATRVQASGVQRVMDFMTARPDGFASLEEVAEAIANYLPSRARRVRPEGLKRVVRQGDDGRWRWHWDPRFIQRTWASDVRNSDETIRQRLDHGARSLQVPTLLVRGRMSDVISPEDVALFRNLVPHCDFVDVQQAGHMVAGDNNDRFTTVVCAFLGLGPTLQTRPK
ncbi:MAG: alpha/beta hydrolase, partial [Myxococcota bacterium]